MCIVYVATFGVQRKLYNEIWFLEHLKYRIITQDFKVWCWYICSDIEIKQVPYTGTVYEYDEKATNHFSWGHMDAQFNYCRTEPLHDCVHFLGNSRQHYYYFLQW